MADWNLRLVLNRLWGEQPAQLPLVGGAAARRARSSAEFWRRLRRRRRSSVEPGGATSSCSSGGCERRVSATRPDRRRTRGSRRSRTRSSTRCSSSAASARREIVVANLLASRLTVLYGPSGVGKTSLLRAAVARSLRALPEEPLVVVFSSWSDDPDAALAEAVREAAGLVDERLGRRRRSSRRSRRATSTSSSTSSRSTSSTTPTTAGQGRSRRRCPRCSPAPLARQRPDLAARGRAREARPLQGADPEPVREHAAARPPRPRGGARCDRCGPSSATRSSRARRSSVEPALVERVLDEVGAAGSSRRSAASGASRATTSAARIEAPYLQLVMQRLWEAERARARACSALETLERLGGAQHDRRRASRARAGRASRPSRRTSPPRIFNHLVTPSGTKIAHDVADLAEFGQVAECRARAGADAARRERRILRSVDEGGARPVRDLPRRARRAVLAWRAEHEADARPRGAEACLRPPAPPAARGHRTRRGAPRSHGSRHGLRGHAAHRGARAGAEREGERARGERRCTSSQAIRS